MTFPRKLAVTFGLYFALNCLALLTPAYGATSGTTTRTAKTAAPTDTNLQSTANKEGNSDAFARANHEHKVSGTLPLANGGTGANALPCDPSTQYIGVSGTALACKDLPVPGGTGATGSAAPGTASYLGAQDSSGNAVGMKTCDLSRPISVTFSGADAAEVIPLPGGSEPSGKIYVCGFFVIANNPVGVQFQAGTGTKCGSSPSVSTGVTALPAGGGFSMGLSPFAVPFTAAANTALCLTGDAAAQLGGWIVYTRQ